jgi:hypothetical protein
LTAGCGDDDIQTSQNTAQTGSAEVSWARGHANINDLTTDADLIAVGTIDRDCETKQESEHFYYTYFAFSIETALKGEAEDEIIILQVGSVDEPWSAVVDDPLFQVGERCLLFLYRSPTGVYSHSGPTTRYSITNNKVYSMNYILQDNEYSAPVTLDFNGVELPQIISNLTEILDQTRLLCPDSIRLLSGETGKIDITLATGKHGTGKVTCLISMVDSEDREKQIPVPTGMEITITPTEFMASPHNDYESVIEIRTDEETITPGEYWIAVEYDIGVTTSGHHLITVHVHSTKLSEIENTASVLILNSVKLAYEETQSRNS